jgi:hypothetical protein
LLGMETADDLKYCQDEDHVKIASKLSVEDTTKYWEMLNLDLNKIVNVAYYRAWEIARQSQHSEHVLKFLDDIGAYEASDLEVLEKQDEKSIFELAALLTHIESNRFLQCFNRFQSKNVNSSVALSVLVQFNQMELVRQRLGISSDEDFFFISESEVKLIAAELPVVPRRKLYHAYEMTFDEIVLSKLNLLSIDEICICLFDSIEDWKFNYGVKESQDFKWLTQDEITTLLETLKMVPRNKIESMLLLNNMTHQHQCNYEAAWNVIQNNPSENAVSFMNEIGLLNVSDLIYVPNESLRTLSRYYRRIPMLRIMEALSIHE